MLQTYMVVPLAVLLEGSLANSLYAMLTAEPLDALIATPRLLEAQIKLVSTILHTHALQPVLLMPAGQPPVTCAAARQAGGLYGLGYGAGGRSVREALADLSRAAERLRARGTHFNEVNEDGLHVSIDEALQLALYINTTAALVEEVCRTALARAVPAMCTLPDAHERLKLAPTSGSHVSPHRLAGASRVQANDMSRVHVTRVSATSGPLCAFNLTLGPLCRRQRTSTSS